MSQFQEYRYVYFKAKNTIGHIVMKQFPPDALCGAKIVGKYEERKTWLPDRMLCPMCQTRLQRFLADKHNVKGW